MKLSQSKFKMTNDFIRIDRIENIQNQKEFDKEVYNNYDKYFSKEQNEYYKKLYDTESFDRPEPIFIKRIRKGELIGEGAFGKVYSAFDEERGMLIAVKQIDLKILKKKSSDYIESVESEINFLANLNHKNIIKYYGIKRTDDDLSILLEYCIGGSISKLLGMYKTLSENIIRKYTTQILEGLEYLHSHNIVHRDIKGANILVDRYGVCKLSDFGGAKMITEDFDIKNSSFRGTPNWMSPESVKKLEYTRFSDIWALGCTLIEMATGEPPWSEYKNTMAVLYHLFNTKYPPEIPQNISLELKDFLECCLRIEPTERLNVFQLLRHPFITGDIIVNNKQEPALNISYDINRYNSKGHNFNQENLDNFMNENSNDLVNNFNSRCQESYNKNMNSEVGLKAHIYDSVRFNLNIASKNGIRKQSDEKENIEGFMSSNSPIILHFKEDKDNRNFTNDEKNLNNNIRIHNTIPNYCNSKDFKTGKIDKYQNQKNINFENFKKTFNK